MKVFAIILGLAGLALGAVTAAEGTAAVSTEFFPFGFFHGDACLLVNCSEALQDPIELRRAKTFHDLARAYVNVVLPANARYQRGEMDMAHHYGLGVIASSNSLRWISREELVNADEAALERVRHDWRRELTELKDHPALLAWHLYDEPLPDFSRSMSRIREFLDANDGKHPVIYTHQNLPLGSSQEEWELLRTSPVIFSDCYSIHQATGRDPWLYGDVAMREFRRVNPQAHYWPIVQSFAYQYRPSLAELRLMVYHTLSRGAKGMFFFTTGQNAVAWPNPDHIQFDESPGNLWFADDEWLDEIGRIGQLLTTAGPLLLPLEYQPDYPNSFTPADSIEANVATPAWCLRESRLFQIPALDLGAFTGPDYDILIVHSDDPNQTRQAELALPVQNPAWKLFDLRRLVEVPPLREAEGKRSYAMTFAPGDGNLYFRGTPDQFAVARHGVLTRRFRQEALLLTLELEVASANRLPIDPVNASLANARAEAEKEPEKALATLTQARTQLAEIQHADPNFRAVRDDLEYMRLRFAALDRQLQELPRDQSWEQSAPELQSYLATLLKLTREFTALDNAFRAGNADPATAAQLRERLRLLAEAMPCF